MAEKRSAGPRRSRARAGVSQAAGTTDQGGRRRRSMRSGRASTRWSPRDGGGSAAVTSCSAWPMGGSTTRRSSSTTSTVDRSSTSSRSAAARRSSAPCGPAPARSSGRRSCRPELGARRWDPSAALRAAPGCGSRALPRPAREGRRGRPRLLLLAEDRCAGAVLLGGAGGALDRARRLRPAADRALRRRPARGQHRLLVLRRAGRAPARRPSAPLAARGGGPRHRARDGARDHGRGLLHRRRAAETCWQPGCTPGSPSTSWCSPTSRPCGSALAARPTSAWSSTRSRPTCTAPWRQGR